MLMAGLDGIQNRIHPGDPIDKNLYDLPPEELKDIPTVCGSLREALENLRADHAFMLKGDVFTKDFIESYIDLRYEEVYAFEHSPHPIEFQMYWPGVTATAAGGQEHNGIPGDDPGALLLAAENGASFDDALRVAPRMRKFVKRSSILSGAKRSPEGRPKLGEPLAPHRGSEGRVRGRFSFLADNDEAARTLLTPAPSPP